MEKETLIQLVRETWNKYGALDHNGLTSTEINEVNDMLDDVERLVS